MKKVFFLISFIFLAGIHRGEATAVFDAASVAKQGEILLQVNEQISKATEQIN